MPTKKKKYPTTSLGPTVTQGSSGMLANTIKKISKRKTETKYAMESAPKNKKVKDVGGKTTAITPEEMMKTQEEGLAELARLRAKQREREKKLKANKTPPKKKATVKKKKVEAGKVPPGTKKYKF